MELLNVVFLLCVIKLSLQQDIHYDNAAVATDVPQCSQLGKQILLDGGSAVDAAIASVLCVGVVNPQSSGIGGGFTMVVHVDQSQTTEALMALERAPQAATPDMFPTREASQYGVETIAIPCEIQGLVMAHERYGSLAWAEIFEPVISLAQNGFKITKHLAYVLGLDSINTDYPEIVDMYRNDDGSVKKEGDMMTAPTLAATLQKIADNPYEIIKGSVAQDIVDDIQEANGILTTDDFSSIEATWEPLVSTTYKNDLTMKSTPNTASGPVLQYILNVLDQYDITSADFENTDKRLTLYHRYLEATKFAFGHRYLLGDATTNEVQKILESMNSHLYADDTRKAINDKVVTSTDRHFYAELLINDNAMTSTDRQFYSNLKMSDNQIDPDEEEGLGDTSHISVLAANGDAVSVTTSVGYYFGSKFYSNQTGVFLNNHMANFYIPARESDPIYEEPTNANSIEPGKRFLTTTCPSLLLDSDGKVKMVVGSSGGSRIVSTNAWVILRTLWMEENLKTAIDERRIHHYLPTSMKAYYERFNSTDGFDPRMHEALEEMGHLVSSSSSFAVVEAILADDNGGMDAYSDPRKGGQADGY